MSVLPTRAELWDYVFEELLIDEELLVSDGIVLGCLALLYHFYS